MYSSSEIGNRIYLARMRKNLKQSAICQALGISQSAFSNVETGKRDITVAEVYILAGILDVSVDWILGIEVDNKFTREEQLKIEEFKLFLINTRKK